MEDLDDMRCSNCTQTFLFQKRNPFLMPCLHSICEQCLLEGGNSFLCKLCNVVEFKQGHPQTDFVRLNEYVLSMATESPERLKCTNQDHDKTSKAYCFGCSHFLCEGCFNIHLQLDATKNHETVSIGDLTTHPLTEWQTKEKCSTHPDYPVSFFCHEPSCQRLICLFCITKDHSGHQTQDIDQAYDQEKELLAQSSFKLQSKISEVKGMIAKKNEVEAQRAKVRDAFVNMRGAVRRRREDILKVIQYQHGADDRSRHLPDQAAKLRKLYDKVMYFHDHPGFKDIENEASLLEKVKDIDIQFEEDSVITIHNDIKSFGQIKEVHTDSPC